MITAFFAGLLAFFAFGSVGFWLLVALAWILFTVAAEAEKYSLAVVSTIVLLVLYHAQLAAITWPMWAAGVVVFGIGSALYSSYRWRSYTNAKVADWNDENKGEKNPNNLAHSYRLLEHSLSVRDNKARITGWITLWPWSLVWHVTGNFFNAIYDHMRGIYEKIALNALDKANYDTESK